MGDRQTRDGRKRRTKGDKGGKRQHDGFSHRNGKQNYVRSVIDKQAAFGAYLPSSYIEEGNAETLGVDAGLLRTVLKAMGICRYEQAADEEELTNYLQQQERAADKEELEFYLRCIAEQAACLYQPI